MKKLLLLSVFVLIQFNVKSQEGYTVVKHEVIGPGITHTHLKSDDPLNINIIEVDLTNPYSHIETVCSHNKMPDSQRETTSSMSSRNSSDRHHVSAAINGDFFSYTPGNSLGMQVHNSEFIKSYGGSQGISFDVNDKPVVGKPVYVGSITANGNTSKIDAINLFWDDLKWFPGLMDNRLVMLNKYYGGTYNNNEGETKVIAEALDKWKVNDGPVKCKVIEITTEDVTPTGEQFVLFALGTGADFVNENLTAGNEFFVTNTITDAYQDITQPQKLVQHIGGYTRFVVNGKDYVDMGINEMNANIDKATRQPRTAIGYSRDSTKLFLVTVDGRQNDFSIGVTMYQMAAFMIEIGAYTAINMDSGGSTTMVINNDVANSPSDASGERPVINALMVVSTAEEEKLNIIPKNIKMLNSEKAQFNFNIWKPAVEVDSTKATYFLKTDFGSITKDGLFTAGNNASNGYVYISYEDKLDSAFVTIKSYNNIEISPKNFVTDLNNTIEFDAKLFDTEGSQVALNNADFDWSTSNAEHGEIDNNGLFTPLANGEVEISATYDGVTGTATVNVEQGAETKILDDFEQMDGWQVTGVNMDNVSVKIVEGYNSEGESAMQIDYEFTYSNQVPGVVLEKEIEIYGLPDSIWADGRYNGKNHRIVFYSETVDGDLVLSPSMFDSNISYNLFGGHLSKNASQHPLTFKKMQIDLNKNDGYAAGETYTGKIFIDNLRVSYPGHQPLTVDITQKNKTKSEIIVYPNPANGVLHLTFSTAIETKQAKIYITDITGKHIFEQTITQLNIHQQKIDIKCENLKSGVYLCILELGNKRIAKKIVIQNQ